ncbi:MAG: CDP-diacylglycerol--serine O-phosphatidyltransferase [Oligoflexia bacterium]|nr:CDP-diacylglycerol--serine O-phosphatidyltransferase [Oligoflexia bacterium]
MQPIKIRSELKDRLYRRRYLVPNAVTLGNMFCGFLTVIYAASGRFEKAVIAIAVAILLDGLDGRVARRLNATSRFGVEFDSFSDLVSFGIAPALLMYYWCFLNGADEFGVAMTFVYALCAASRLARFNISAENLQSFVGLPTPGAAGAVAAIVNCAPWAQNSWWAEILGTCVMLGLAYLMVSRVEFFSIKRMKLKGLRLFARVALGLLIALIWYNSRIGFLVLAFGYVGSGMVALLLQRLRPAAPINAAPGSERLTQIK